MNSYQFNAAQQIILIVDDLPDNLRVLSNTLTKQGYQVRCAKNGSMALRGVQAAAPDLILLDIKMPDMDGYQVCQHLKATPASSDIPVIFMSALDDVLDKVKAFEVGGVDYITKPFQVEEVLARVKSQLALQAAKKEIHQLNVALELRIEQRTAQLATANHELQKEVTDRKLAEHLLQESEEKLEGILSSLEEVVWSICATTRELLYINPAAQRVYGHPPSTFFNNSGLWLEVVHPDDRQQFTLFHHNLLDVGQTKLEYRILRSDGEVRWLSLRCHVIYNKQGAANRIDGIIEDITQRKQVEAQLVHDALHDDLTKLPNRTLFIQRVEQALQTAKKYKDYSFAVLFIDLDRFKLINDSLGHAMGDRLLVAISQVFQQCLRPVDTVARLGGDEFTILLDGIKNINDATAVAQRLQEELSSAFELENYQVFTSASIGIVSSSTDYQQAADLLRDADIAMYRAKEQGKARHTIFDAAMYEQTRELLQLENDLHLALERQEFCLHYQPIVSLVTGKLTGFEALVRWMHPAQGLISPAKFIPVAEDTGLIVPLGEWVLREACRQMQDWRRKFPAFASLNISVNLASSQLKESNLTNQIKQIIVNTGLDASCLKLELTESMLMEDLQKTIDTLLQLKAMDIKLSIDDFGTGYSSLSYLHRFPIDTLKIDRSFINKISSNPEECAVVKTIITLAHTLGMDAIAEGVETCEQSIKLKAWGCEFGQGHLFSKPLNSSAVEAMLSA